MELYLDNAATTAIDNDVLIYNKPDEHKDINFFLETFSGRGFSDEPLQSRMTDIIMSLTYDIAFKIKKNESASIKEIYERIKFDINYDVKLSTYAIPYIMGEIKRFLRDDGPIKISRSIKELGIKIREVQRDYLTKHGEDIKISEIATILNVSIEDIAVALDATRPIDSIDEEAYEGDEKTSKISKISNNKDDVGDLINKITIKKLINELDSRQKQIIILRYFKEKTQTEVAKALGISQVQVSRIEKKILSNMREKIS